MRPELLYYNLATMKERASGILLHITSLPSAYGIGDMGPGAYEFVDFLAGAGQRYWQVLPITPTSSFSADSPYSGSSAFAGNTLLISPELLVKDGLLDKEELKNLPALKVHTCNYHSARKLKTGLLNLAFERFRRDSSIKKKLEADFEGFLQHNSYWLEDYALFEVLKELNDQMGWIEWDEEFALRNGEALRNIREKHEEDIRRVQFSQFLFFRQWGWLKAYCKEKGIRIVGDIPIYVNFDSVDVWSRPEIFKLDSARRPIYVSGVPPDYFSRTGQLWGNPVYNWDYLESTDFSWWLERMRHNLNLFDIVRIDHFRGLVGYWEIPAGEKTAVNGKWVKAPSDKFFSRLRSEFEELPIIAEDLGVITDDVRETMRKFEIPGMRVLLFAFDDDNPQHPYLPHNYIPDCVVYTGTHDNNTARGWFENEASKEARKRLFAYVGRKLDAEEVPIELIRLIMMSSANTVLVPMQDVLGLDERARMNRPATSTGNWLWRVSHRELSNRVKDWLGEITYIYGRSITDESS